MYEVTIYWLDDRERKHILGSVKAPDKTKEAARETAMEQLWHNGLDATPGADFRELSPDELNELAREDTYLQDNCPQCGMSNGIHEANAPELSRDVRLCNSCYDRLHSDQ